MRVAPARDTSLRLGRDPSHPALGRRFRLGEPVRCAREGCHETFFFGVQSHVCPITAFCPEHQPAEVLRGWPSARRGRGPSDGTAREDDDPPPPGPRPYVAILSDDGARRVALACRACGHIQTRAGAPECGCAARWVVRVPGASVAQRFCVGCRRYHDLARFEDPDVPDHLRPRRACAWYRERLHHRVGDSNTAAPAPDPRDEDPSDDPSYPTDRFLAGAFSLFSAKFPARADDFAASEPRDAFVDGLLSHHARQEPARQSKRRERAHGGEGVRVRFIPANADASAAGTSDATTRTRRGERTADRTAERTAERTTAFASTSSFARTPSGSFVEPPPLDASGARFGYLSAIPDDAAPCVGMDAVDLPSFALARVDSRRAMERVLFAGATDARSERRARWTADDAPRTRARASAAAATEGARLVEPSSFSSLATSALDAGARVLASVEGVLLEATKDRDGVPQLRLMMGNPADPPPRGLPPGALLNGARAAVALVGRAGHRGSLARVVLRHVPGLDVDVRLRCRFAGHFLPVATVASRGFLLDRTRTVVEIDASPPEPGFAPLEGAAFLETVAIRGPAAGLPVGHPVPVLLTTDPGARDEMNAATKRAAEKSDSDAASRRVAWWLTCAMTAKTERACSREFVRRVVEYAWRAGAYRTLDALLRAHAHLPDVDANVARTCDVAASGTSASLGDSASTDAESPEALARTLASLDWSDADDVDARSFRDRTFTRAVRSPPREGESNRGEPTSRRGEVGAAAYSDVADSAIGHAFDEHVRHRRERQRERRRGRRRASRSDAHLRWWDSAGVLILFTFSRVFDWRRPSHWLKVLMDGCFWRAREVFWDRVTTRTRAAMREYRATGSTWAHELVMRRIVVLRASHMCLTSAQFLFGSFLSPEWFDDRIASAYAYRSVMLGRKRAGVAPETVPEFLQRWVLFLIVITLAKMAHNVKLVRAADLADFTVKPASGFSYQAVNHFIVVHLCCVLRCVCLHGPLGWLRASAEEWLARAWWAAFIVADSLVAAGVLLCIAGRTRAGTRDRSVPFSFSRFVRDGEGTSDDERGWDDGVGR